jgi:transposase InsO family protein
MIRSVLTISPFSGEGHRKAWARLRANGIRSSKRRVLRLMRENGLLAPGRVQRTLGPRAHDGTIVTSTPNEMWGTDGTQAFTTEEGAATVFIAVEHCTAECVGIHAAKRGTRYEALEPIRQAVKDRFGSYAADVATGLSLRHDHGSQYTSNVFQDELRFLGIESSPAFVRAPEGNGCAERFIRTLKEQLLWVKTFRTVEELRLALLEFARRYNDEWIVARHNYLTPNQARRELSKMKEAA